MSEGLPFADMAPSWELTLAPRGLSVPGRLYLSYAAEGGPLLIFADREVPRRYRVVDPRSGAVVREGVRAPGDTWVPDEGGAPRVYICCDEME